jgi:hypothetical protein
MVVVETIIFQGKNCENNEKAEMALKNERGSYGKVQKEALAETIYLFRPLLTNSTNL